ncbi:MAG: adenylate/guanylate cyclase domain-containing protein [Pseudomonadota bacterium]
MERRLAAILAADVVGYSKHMGQDEAGTLAALSELIAQVIKPLVAEHRGRIVKLMGDGILAEFASVVDAVTCAVAWQDKIAEHGDRLQFRIGVNLGDVILQGGDIFGNGVNVAARLEGLAEPGGICLSESVRGEVKGKLDLAFEDLGELSVKNIAEPLRAYRVRPGTPIQVQSAPASPDRLSIAVLPLTNMTGDPEQDYFSDGITEDIITELSRFSVLRVAARHSAFGFKGQNLDIKEIGRRLGVHYVVEGSVRRAGKRVRITAQLVEIESGKQVWAERYDRELEDIFEVQDQVTRSIVGVLPGRVQEAVADAASRKRPENMKAYELLLKGKAIRDSFGVEDTAEARPYFEKAIALDPRYAKAHAYLADTYFVDLFLGLGNDKAATRSLDLARKAVALDGADIANQDQLGFAYISVGQWQDAEVQFTKALAQVVTEAEPMNWIGYGFLMLGQPEKARDIVREAKRLDPLHPPSFDWVLGQACFFAESYEEAARVLHGQALLNSFARACLAGAHARLGQQEEARNALASFVEERHREFASRDRAVDADTIGVLADGYRRMWRRPADWDLLAEGLRLAGLSE